MTEILIPPPWPGLRSSYRKVRARGSWDFALAGAALAVEIAGETVRSARVWLSGVAPVPWRAPGVEQAITGKKLTPAVVTAAAEAAVSGAEPLAKNGYKVPLLRAVIEEELTKIVQDTVGEKTPVRIFPLQSSRANVEQETERLEQEAE